MSKEHKAIRISNSGINRYSGCARSYKYHYIEGYRSKLKSSALLFGSAIDAACNHLLENFDTRTPDTLVDAIAIFDGMWEQQEDRDTGTITVIRDNPLVKYFKSDFDAQLINEWDKDEGLQNRDMVEDALKNGAEWIDLDESLRLEYNIMTWHSLSKKGPLMLIAYFNEILPQFKRILTLQRKIELLDDEGNIVNGIAEFVAELQDGRICLVDNKTSGSDYADDSVRTSQQLALYKQILDIQSETVGAEWQTKIDCAAYAVMHKKITKDRVCTSCGHHAAGTHKTCNNEIAGVRCGGAWGITNRATTQFIVDKISDKFGAAVLENASNIITCVDKGIFPKNFDRCHNDFGQKCPFISKCHGKGNESMLFQLEKKEKQ